jgi:hypothetical protein
MKRQVRSISSFSRLLVGNFRKAVPFYELQNLACSCISVAVIAFFTTAFLQQEGVNLQHTKMLLPSIRVEPAKQPKARYGESSLESGGNDLCELRIEHQPYAGK